MQRIENLIRSLALEAVQSLWNTSMEEGAIQVQKTRRDFKGDFTVVVFPLLRHSRLSPELTGETMGQFIIGKSELISDYNVIKGFLNLVVDQKYWKQVLELELSSESYGENRSSRFCPQSDDRIFIAKYQ